MSIKAMKDYTFAAKYATWLPEKQRRETWPEAVARVKGMMLTKYKDEIEQSPKLKEYIDFAYNMMLKKKVLGSQRALQFGGKPTLERNLRVYNCLFSYANRERFFQETMYSLLCGCGVGLSVQKHHVQKLPKLSIVKEDKKKFVIEDSIEGWADSIGVLVCSYFEKSKIWPEYSATNVSFDYTKIRKKGESISSGGKAPGPEPLKEAHRKIRAILNKAIENAEFASGKLKKLKPIEVYDIVMHASDAVLAGGVRRSSTIALFSKDDEEMMKAKTGNWFIDNPQRARSNNSVMLLRDKTTWEEFQEIMENVKEYGEPGFIWSDSLEMGVNPCQPDWAKVFTKDGIKTFGEINIGDEIWSCEGWTKITGKWSTGIKDVYRYYFGWEDNVLGIFEGTRKHRVVSGGIKQEVQSVNSCDCFDTTVSLNNIISKVPLLESEYVSTEEVFDITVDNNSHTYWTQGCNVSNCSEISLFPIDEETGESGFQGCNLSTINAQKIKSLEDFIEAGKAVSIIGTLQAGFTDFSYFTETSQKIFEREALLGCSMTGIMEKHDIVGDPKNQRKVVEQAKKINEEVAELIGINQSARISALKPEGSASCLLGTSSGIHPHHAKRYIRRIQANKMEPLYNKFKEVNPTACEESVWDSNHETDVISFCVEVPDGAKTKNQIGALKLLEIVKSTQQNWVLPGTNKELCVKPWLNHSVSNTVTVKPEEWGDVTKYIYDNRKYFCGVSLLPATGDKDYPQAPFTTVYLPSEQVAHYGDGVMFVSGLIDKALELWEDNLWQACDDLNGVGKQIRGEAKRKWKERCKKYAENYFEDDVKKLTYAMKDVYNYKKWTELKREYKDVDYTEVIETEDNTVKEQDVACSGGSCELV